MKVFCMFADDQHHDGHIAVWLPPPIGIQQMGIAASPAKSFKPPNVGVRGWIGVELARVIDDGLDLLIRQAWRMAASQKLQATLMTSGSGLDHKKTAKAQSAPREHKTE